MTYELTWTRLLRHVFGSSSLAVSTVLTIFIGGLALGAYLAGKKIDYFRKAKSLLHVYGYIELGVAIYAALVPLLFSDALLAPLWANFVSPLIDNILLSSLVRFVFVAALILLPTVMMGMTLPILSEYLSEHKYSSEKIGYLYAINTAGAILGSFATGFIFLAKLGLNQSIILASLMNAAIFFAVIYVSKNKKLSINDRETETESKAPKSLIKELSKKTFSSFSKESLLAIVFLTGFAALSLEVIWSKLLGLILGSSSYSFTIILCTFLTGICLGAFALNASLKNIKDPSKFLLGLLALLALSIFLISSIFNEIPWVFLSLTKALPNMLSSLWWLSLNIVQFFVAAILMLPVSIITGAIFTFVLVIYPEHDQKPSSSTASKVSQVYYTNTLGSILGSFATGFILIPFLNNYGSGMQNSIKLVIALILIMVFVLMLEADKRPQRNFFAKLPVLFAVVLSFLLMPNWQAGAMSSGVGIYHGLAYKGLSKNQYKQVAKMPVLFHKEGLNTVVTVYENKGSNAIFLKNNGKNEAAIPQNSKRPSKADMVTQILLGELPMLIHPEKAENVLVIGMGSGCTVGSTLRSEDLKEVEVCELEKAVIEAQGFFEPSSKQSPLSANGSPLDTKRNPLASKVKVHAADGRNFLLTNKKQYDVIISQPSDPWISGASDLYTKEFWQLSAKHLKDDGLFAQWLQLYSITPDLLATVLNTFKQAFKEIYIFRPGESGELILIGSKSKLKLNPERINARINHRFNAFSENKKLIVSPSEDLARISIHSARDLLVNLILETQGIEDFITEHSKKKINTDNNMKVEFSVPQKANLFYASQDVNVSTLAKFIDTKELSRIFTFNSSTKTNSKLSSNNNSQNSAFLAKLALKHNELVASSDLDNYHQSIHGKIALGLAEEALDSQESPLSYLPFVTIFYNMQRFQETQGFLAKAKANANNWQKAIRDKKAKADNFAALSEIFYFDTKLDAAIGYINQAIKLDPNAENYSKLGLFYYEQYRKLKRDKFPESVYTNSLNRSEAAYKNAIKANPRLAKAWAGLGNIEFLRASKFKKKTNSHVYSFKNDYPIENNKALKKAIKAYKQANKRDVHFWPAFLNLGKLYSTMGNKYLGRAIRALKDASTINPRAMEAYYHLANIEYERGSLDKAYKYLSKVVRFCSTNKDQERKVSSFCSGPGGISYNQLQEAKAKHDKLTKLIKGESLVEDNFEPIVLN